METLYVLLEGGDDKRFFDKVFRTKFSKFRIKIYLYAARSKESNKKYIENLRRNSWKYIVFADSDSSDACIGKSKQRLKHKIPNTDESRTAIVRTEIESWYMAGIGHASARKLDCMFQSSTDDMTKEAFDELIFK